MPRKPGGIVENLRKWYADTTGRVMLTPQEEEQYQRIRQAWALLSDVVYPRTNPEIVKILMQHYGIRSSVAYETITYAKELYGDITVSDTASSREILYGFFLEAYRIAHKQQDPKAMIAAASKMAQLRGLDKDTADLPDFSKVEPGDTIVNLQEGEFKQIAMLLSGGVIDLNKRLDAEEIEFELLERGDQKGN